MQYDLMKMVCATFTTFIPGEQRVIGIFFGSLQYLTYQAFMRFSIPSPSAVLRSPVSCTILDDIQHQALAQARLVPCLGSRLVCYPSCIFSA